MNPLTTALILIGYQNDYFGRDGLLNQVNPESSKIDKMITNTVELIKKLPDSVLIISTPIGFTSSYQELGSPVGILKNIKDVGALQLGTKGVQLIDSLSLFQERIVTVNGKRGFNAFEHTNLDYLLRKNNIHHVVIAGSITSICIDATARAAYELDYRVAILSDCTVAKSIFEQEFYCENIFPIYADVINSKAMLDNLLIVS